MSSKIIEGDLSSSNGSLNIPKYILVAFSGALYPHSSTQCSCFMFGSPFFPLPEKSVGLSGVCFWRGAPSLGVNSALVYWIWTAKSDACSNKIVWEPQSPRTTGRWFNVVSLQQPQGCIKKKKKKKKTENMLFWGRPESGTGLSQDAHTNTRLLYRTRYRWREAQSSNLLMNSY